jgi:hypothetical protein
MAEPDIGRNRKFASISLQGGVCCEPAPERSGSVPPAQRALSVGAYPDAGHSAMEPSEQLALATEQMKNV